MRLCDYYYEMYFKMSLDGVTFFSIISAIFHRDKESRQSWFLKFKESIVFEFRVKFLKWTDNDKIFKKMKSSVKE